MQVLSDLFLGQELCHMLRVSSWLCLRELAWVSLGVIEWGIEFKSITYKASAIPAVLSLQAPNPGLWLWRNWGTIQTSVDSFRKENLLENVNVLIRMSKIYLVQGLPRIKLKLIFICVDNSRPKQFGKTMQPYPKIILCFLYLKNVFSSWTYLSFLPSPHSTLTKLILIKIFFL